MLVLSACWVRIDSEAVGRRFSIAACWARVPVLDNSERGFERGLNHSLESPVLIL